jgi:hypothetical protein
MFQFFINQLEQIRKRSLSSIGGGEGFGINDGFTHESRGWLLCPIAAPAIPGKMAGP